MTRDRHRQVSGGRRHVARPGGRESRTRAHVCSPREHTLGGSLARYLVGVSEGVCYPVHEDDVPQEEAEQRDEGGAFPVNP